MPLCLLEALRADLDVYVRRVKAGWVVEAAGKALARRKHKEKADELLSAAREEVARTASPAVDLSARRRGVVVTPQRREGEAVRYELMELDDLVFSHQVSDFQPNPAYPASVQERVYHLDKGEQAKVVKNAQRLDPELLLVRDPTPINGPPLVTEPPYSIGLGGNGRGMMMQLAASKYGESYAGYRRALRERAGEFGHSPMAVDAMRKPALVRVVEGLRRDRPADELAAAVRRYNEGLTQGMDATTRAVAQARVLSADTLRDFGELLASGEASLREVMAASPAPILAALTRDGVVTDQNRTEWTESGRLTERGKDLVEGMFLGSVMGTAERIRRSAPALLQRVERAVPFLVAVRATQAPGFDLVPDFLQAVDALNEARARGLTLDELDAQGSLFGGEAKLTPVARAVAGMLDGNGPRAVGEAFRRWASAVSHDPRQGVMFGAPPSPDDGLRALLGRVPNPGCGCRKDNPSRPRVKCTHCDGTGRVSPYAGNVTWCPACGGVGTVQQQAKGERPLRGQLRLVNPGEAPASTRRPKKKAPPVELASKVQTTRGLAGQLMQSFRGKSWPKRVVVTLESGERMDLHFRRGALVRVMVDGRTKPAIFKALSVDLQRRSADSV